MRYFLLIVSFLLFTPGLLYAQVGDCEPAQAQATLDIGNVRAAIYNDGGLFWKGGQQVYEYPKGSGLSTLFVNNLWVAGMMNGELRAAASTYGPYDFWPGPLDATGNPPSDCSLYDSIWEIRSEDFEQFESDGTFSDNMMNWPWELGAPVIDGDGDPGNYNLEGGDRPELLGDQSLWWIMNDRGNTHDWSETEAIGLEVHGTAYAFQAQNAIQDITFYRYRIINKNTLPLTDALVGIMSDPDLGNASDDYVGSDSVLHMTYTYNADNDDEVQYGEAPPATGVMFLITPEAPMDGIDNDNDGDVDESGEQFGMYSAMNTFNGGGPIGDPANGSDAYNYMRAFWLDGQPLTEGGIGRDYSDKQTRYAFPGDPTTRSFWSDIEPGENNEAPNPGSNRKFTMASGPMTLAPGDTSQFLIAVISARGEDFLSSVSEIKNLAQSLQIGPESYLSSGYSPGQSTNVEPPPQFVLGFDQNFPNPFSGLTTLRYSLPKTMQVRLTVYDMLGREIETLAEGAQDAGIYSLEFDGSNLPAGIYFARIEMDHLSFTKKLVRVP